MENKTKYEKAEEFGKNVRIENSVNTNRKLENNVHIDETDLVQIENIKSNFRFLTFQRIFQNKILIY